MMSHPFEPLALGPVVVRRGEKEADHVAPV